MSGRERESAVWRQYAKYDNYLTDHYKHTPHHQVKKMYPERLSMSCNFPNQVVKRTRLQNSPHTCALCIYFMFVYGVCIGGLSILCVFRPCDKWSRGKNPNTSIITGLHWFGHIFIKTHRTLCMGRVCWRSEQLKTADRKKFWVVSRLVVVVTEKCVHSHSDEITSCDVDIDIDDDDTYYMQIVLTKFYLVNK